MQVSGAPSDPEAARVRGTSSGCRLFRSPGETAISPRAFSTWQMQHDISQRLASVQHSWALEACGSPAAAHPLSLPAAAQPQQPLEGSVYALHKTKWLATSDRVDCVAVDGEFRSSDLQQTVLGALSILHLVLLDI